MPCARRLRGEVGAYDDGPVARGKACSAPDGKSRVGDARKTLK
jgi:hypothetical protein